MTYARQANQGCFRSSREFKLTRQIALEHTKPALRKVSGLFHLEPRMVKTREQAECIQKKRYFAGKVGVAKAVRRFMRRTKQEWNCALACNAWY